MAVSSSPSIGFQVIDLGRLFRQAFERRVALEGLEVTAGEARTLLYAAMCDGVRQNALAERMRVEPMTLTNFLDRLERRGFVERRPDPDDRRANRIFVTAAAAPLVDRVRDLAADVRRTAMRGLTASEVEAFRHALQVMRENLSEPSEAQMP